MNKIPTIFFHMLLVSLVGCSPAVYTDKAADANFGSYQTYAMLPTGENSEDSTTTIYTEKIINEVNQEMKARGYELDNQNPDLLVNVKTMYQEEEKTVNTGYPATYGYYTSGFYAPTTLAPYYYTGYAGIPRVTGTGIRSVEYTEGTFVVDIIEAKDGKNQVVWRGWSETPVDPADLDSSIREYVDNIFEEYPVEVDKS